MSDSNAHLPYMTHKNGRGKLFDTSEADLRSIVDRHSEISEDSSIWRSKIIASQVKASLISSSIIDSSFIAYSNIHGSVVENSEVAAEFIGENTRISGCSILGKSRVANGAVCVNVAFRDLTVLGPARLENWNQDAGTSLEGSHGYVTRGIWLRPPRIFRISPTITVTEGVPGFAFVHCREKPISEWLRIGHRYGSASNWTTNEILAVRKVMHTLQNH